MPDKRLDIAIIGTRGIPGRYGGFETFAEKLSVGLVAKGHRITVYCPFSSNGNKDKEYQGVRLLFVPNIAFKSLDKISNSFMSCFYSVFSDSDIILFLGVSPVLFAWLPRFALKKTVINIDGLEWKREKWSKFASFFLKMSESLSGKICHEVVTDSKAIQAYYKNRYGKNSTFIAYGADIGKCENDEVLKKYGLEKKRYLLQVCRLERENNSHILIREYSNLKTEMPLVILGDAPYSEKYKEELKKMADDRVRFLGSVYGEEYHVLRSHPFCYIHAHEVGGTNPALLEALAAGNCVVVLNVPYNLEVIEDAGLSFSKESGSMAQEIKKLIDNPHLASELGKKAVERINNNYSWEKIINQYESLFFRTLGV